jgi:hypothetical protein
VVPGGQGTREVHNRLEKFRRAQLKECYDDLRRQLPNISDSRKVSNLIVLRNAHKYIQVSKVLIDPFLFPLSVHQLIALLPQHVIAPLLYIFIFGMFT